ncbi:MAG: TrkH family potassium uptake protein [Candidatus Tantalella remota]|nr:TrkH family potassium uptake protein [Candidatus Tantalella remota]
MRKTDKIIYITIIVLGVISVILENDTTKWRYLAALSHVLDFAICFIFASRYLLGYIVSQDKKEYFRNNLLEIWLVSLFLLVFMYGKYHFFFMKAHALHDLPVKIIFALSIFITLRALAQTRRLAVFLRNLTAHPAQTIMLSFFGVIIVGAILLAMPMSTYDNTRIGFINALFTSTSATCVTGLTVVDTATRFSGLGKLVIMCLIQIGGLGIMILAYFTAFLVGRKLSHQDRMMMSYMLDEDDARNLGTGVKNIVLITLILEICGAALLFFPLKESVGGNMRTVFYSVFHSVSAFCNAGFALFSDNFEKFRSFGFFNIVIAALIIAGGLSFIVLSNAFGHIMSKGIAGVKRGHKVRKLTLNTKVVLTVTAILIIAGTLLIYKFEHKENLLQYDIKTQYLMSFFQSVTLRTTGFNTMDMSNLRMSTYSLMMLFMFIGGASGSTAGGIKVNTLGVAWAYFKSVFTGKDDVVLLKHSVSKDLINQAFFVILLSLAVVFGGAMLLTITEKHRFYRIIFEAFSAFGTVGLTTGITPELTKAGKIVITILMFMGRLGPLTLIAALARKTSASHIKYPEGKINIG